MKRELGPQAPNDTQQLVVLSQTFLSSQRYGLVVNNYSDVAYLEAGAQSRCHFAAKLTPSLLLYVDDAHAPLQ